MNLSRLNFLKGKSRSFWERILVAVTIALILSFGFLQGWIFQPRSNLPFFGNLLLLAFINLNVILLLLLSYLVLRNIVKLVFERRRRILGSKLKTRLVIASVGLTLIPAIPLFWIASQFIFSSLDHWFSSEVEKSLETSVLIARQYIGRDRQSLISDCIKVMPQVAAASLARPPSAIIPLLDEEDFLFRNRMDAVFVYNSAGVLKWAVRQENALRIDPEILRNSFISMKKTPATRIVNITPGELDALTAMVKIPAGILDHSAGGEMIAIRLFPAPLTQKFSAITRGYENYLQLKMLHVPLKKSHFITFSIVTVLAVFAAIWFGFYLAKNLSGPIQDMVSATRRIAEGDLDLRLKPGRQDEIGMLMESFNSMTDDLREGREKLDNAYKALQSTNFELEARRRYMEIVLKNIAAGVISVDAEGNITTMNNSALAMFGLRAEEAIGQHYSRFLDPSHNEIVRFFEETYRNARQPYLERQAQVKVSGIPMSILIKVSVLRDDKDQYMGLVVVLDDLTELEKAQRMAAWREVARRIAHEIKNPLTPIQLSAQRLRRKYPQLINNDEPIFDECTNTIVRQVDHMKHLVNEFSKFARLPRARLTPCSLSEIIEEGLSLYRHDFGHISFKLEEDGTLPPLRLDRDQFRQVIINLIENAVHAIGQEEGEVSIRMCYYPDLKIARMDCADTGHGIAREDRMKVFEPYYSTKEKGTGLGLAIVSNII
ncbi:MAG: HAMP domain-containing protein, partial [Syntrophobacteraceae bacterium]